MNNPNVCDAVQSYAMPPPLSPPKYVYGTHHARTAHESMYAFARSSAFFFVVADVVVVFWFTANCLEADPLDLSLTRALIFFVCRIIAFDSGVFAHPLMTPRSPFAPTPLRNTQFIRVKLPSVCGIANASAKLLA